MGLTFDFELVFLLWASVSPPAYLRTSWGSVVMTPHSQVEAASSLQHLSLENKGPLILFVLHHYLSDTLSAMMMVPICLCILRQALMHVRSVSNAVLLGIESFDSSYPHPPRAWITGMGHSLCPVCSGNHTQGFPHVRQVLCQLSHIPMPARWFLRVSLPLPHYYQPHFAEKETEER